MKTMEILVFLENTPGSLARPARILGENGVNILGLSVSTAVRQFNHGILRLIVDNPRKARRVLSQHKFLVIAEEVVAVEVPNVPGVLAQITDVLSKGDLNIEYLYACSIGVSGENIVLILRVIRTNEAVAFLQKAGLKVLKGEELHGQLRS